MKNKFLTLGLVAIVMTCGSFATGTRADSGPVVHTADGLPYVSGGVGEESQQRLSARAGEFNVKLVFATKSGAYLSKVGVAIADAKGKKLLDATSEGPWFLMKLPLGNYQVVANYAGKALEQTIAVDGTALRTVDFRWADE
jgi:hypothetical protein